jgi:hypothetical protein
MHFQVKNILKSNHNYTSNNNCQIFYTCFLLHINLNHNFYQIRI